MTNKPITEGGCCDKCLKCPDYSEHNYCHDKRCPCHTEKKVEVCPECQFETPAYPHEKYAHHKDCSRGHTTK